MAIGDRIRKAKESFCARKAEVGDVVRVDEGGDWANYNHPVGGQGKWAVFIAKKGDKASVRPMTADGGTSKAVTVAKITHLDDVITDAALAYYKTHRLGQNNGKPR